MHSRSRPDKLIGDKIMQKGDREPDRKCEYCFRHFTPHDFVSNEFVGFPRVYRSANRQNRTF